MATLSDINTEIYNLLDGLTGTSQPLSAAYAYPNPKSPSYPYAFPVWLGGNEEFLTNNKNKSSYSFVVRIVILDEADQDTYNQLLDAADDVLTELRKSDNITLNGKAVKMAVSPNIEVNWTAEGQTKIIAIDIELTVETLSSVT